MKPENNNRNVTTVGSQAAASFEISANASAHIMGILREGLYTDRILAVLREYSANAWDAHRSVGKHNVPIEIHLPTREDQVFRVRDHGPGLSHDEMFQIFTQYGESTKRDSNDVVGQLGIGSKSGFAYSDTFTVISRHGGMRRTYVAALDESEKGTLVLLDERSCEPGDTGLEIQIATKPGDVYEWQHKAERLFQHFEPRPTINIELPAPPSEVTRLTHGAIFPDGEGQWTAIMGCIPYRLNLEQLDAAQLPKCVGSLSGQLRFAIGEVSMSASREELKYTSQTKAAIVKRMAELVDEYVAQVLALLETQALKGWEARLRVRVLARLGLPLPEEWAGLGEAFVTLTYDPKMFSILHGGAALSTRISVDADTKLWIDDCRRELKGYNLSADDYVVRSAIKTPVEIRAALDTALTAAQLSGVQIDVLSNRDWQEWRVPKKKTGNPKHRARMFQLDQTRTSHSAPWSDNWEPVTREPDDEDVYVKLIAFVPGEDRHWFREYRQTVEMARAIGMAVPPVYGYKHTEAKPARGMRGRPWSAWVTEVITTAERLFGDRMEEYQWAYGPSNNGLSELVRLATVERVRSLSASLGVTHPLVVLVERIRMARIALEPIHMILQGLRPRVTWDQSQAKPALEALHARYPLLSGRMESLVGAHSYYSGGADQLAAVEYVKLIDAKEQLLAEPASPAVLKVVS